MNVHYLGNATFVVSADETTFLVDPYIEENPECPYDVPEVLDEYGPIDAVLVTHLAGDHLGDCVALAHEHGLPVVSDPGVRHYLVQKGVPGEQVLKLVWGQTADVHDCDVRALETRHISGRADGDDYFTGLPLSFLVSADGTSVYHMGDTALNPTLRPFGDLYDPDVALVGVGQAYDASTDDAPFVRNVAEMTTEEAVLATQWLDPDAVVPMHYLPGEREAFVDALGETEDPPEVVELDPGDSAQF